MADRRSLLDTGKDIGSSAAGTLKSAAGTLAEKGKQGGQKAKSVAGTLSDKGRSVASATKQGVVERYNELTDETVTDQEQARIERARQEAREEARQEARREFQEEFRENMFDEAFESELQRLRRENLGPSKSERAVQTVTDVAQTVDERANQQVQQTRQPQRQPPQPRQNMALFGVPQRPQKEPPATSAPTGVENIFGVNSKGQNQETQQDPLFGFRF